VVPEAPFLLALPAQPVPLRRSAPGRAALLLARRRGCTALFDQPEWQEDLPLVGVVALVEAQALRLVAHTTMMVLLLRNPR
jgi:hypothetical protein